MESGDHFNLTVNSSAPANFSLSFLAQPTLEDLCLSSAVPPSPNLTFSTFVTSTSDYEIAVARCSSPATDFSVVYCRTAADDRVDPNALVALYQFLSWVHLTFLAIWLINALKFKAYFIPLHTFFLLHTICSILTDFVSASAWRIEPRSGLRLRRLQWISESLNIGVLVIGIGRVCDGWCIFKRNLSTRAYLRVVLPSFVPAASHFLLESSQEQSVVLLSLIVNFFCFVGYVTATGKEIDRMAQTIRKLGKSEPQIQAKFRLACGFLQLIFMTIVALSIFFFMLTLTNAPPIALAILRAAHELILSGGWLDFFLIREEYIKASHP
jgi:hypothetical protein